MYPSHDIFCQNIFFKKDWNKVASRTVTYGLNEKSMWKYCILALAVEDIFTIRENKFFSFQKRNIY